MIVKCDAEKRFCPIPKICSDKLIQKRAFVFAFSCCSSYESHFPVSSAVSMAFICCCNENIFLDKCEKRENYGFSICTRYEHLLYAFQSMLNSPGYLAYKSQQFIVKYHPNKRHCTLAIFNLFQCPLPFYSSFTQCLSCNNITQPVIIKSVYFLNELSRNILFCFFFSLSLLVFQTRQNSK